MPEGTQTSDISMRLGAILCKAESPPPPAVPVVGAAAPSAAEEDFFAEAESTGCPSFVWSVIRYSDVGTVRMLGLS